jgi:hypothetical protein
MTRARALAVLVTCAALAPARPVRAGVRDMWIRVQDAVERAVAERGPRPPVPVPVTWRERRIASVDLGAELLAMTVADLDRDGRAELVALTTREVVVLAVAAGGVREVARAGVGGQPAARRPRDAVGALVIDAAATRTVVWARSSEVADAIGLAWSGKGALAEVGRQAGFPICRGGTVELARGRNYFGGASATWKGDAAVELPAELFGAVCRDDLVDATGRPMAVAAVIGVDRVLRVVCRGASGACDGIAREVDGAGVATAIADVDNDGHPEVLSTRGGAPGDRDRVTVLGAGGKVFARDFHAGVVGLAVGDVDGDGDRDVVAAVRFAGSTQASFWTLN